MIREKKMIGLVFAFLAILLVLLPFLVTFNEFITKIVEKIGIYVWIQKLIVPWEARMISVLISPFNIDFSPTTSGMRVNSHYANITWNCIGWQSMLLLVVSLFFGLGGGVFSRISKIKTIFIGIVGTIFVNLLRMAFTIILLAYWPPLFAIVYHNYLAAIVTILWLFFFWWFCHSFILESPKEERTD